MDRRVQIVRFWALAVIGLVLCCFAPEAIGVLIYGGYSLTPVGLFMPVFETAGGCANCDPTHDDFQVDIADLANSTCSQCTLNNGTWFPVRGTGTSCLAQDIGSGDICPGQPASPFPPSAELEFVFSGGLYGIVVNSGNSFFVHAFGASPPDCSALSALDVPYSHDVGGLCNGSGATVTVSSI